MNEVIDLSTLPPPMRQRGKGSEGKGGQRGRKVTSDADEGGREEEGKEGGELEARVGRKKGKVLASGRERGGGKKAEKLQQVLREEVEEEVDEPKERRRKGASKSKGGAKAADAKAAISKVSRRSQQDQQQQQYGVDDNGRRWGYF